MARLLMVFVDGVGLGSGDARRNPLAASWPALEGLAGAAWTAQTWTDETAPARVRRALDARLGTPGLPQSATGQTALLTGRNAAAVMGRHYGPWPGPTLRTLLAQGSLFSDAGTGAACLANAYPDGYLAAVRGVRDAAGRPRVDASRRRWRPSAPVVAALHAGAELLGVDAFLSGAAVAPDLDGRGFARRLGRAVPSGLVRPERQAEVLARLAGRHAFTFLDVWTGDHAGHDGDARAASAFVDRLARFLDALAPALPADVSLVVTSDHGNLEDLGQRGHTLAPVPLLALGPDAGAFAGARSLTDVAPAVRRVIERSPAVVRPTG